MALTPEQLERARIIRAQMHKAGGVLAETADDAALLEMPLMFDAWQPDMSYPAGTVLRHRDGLYRVQQVHTSQAHQPPDGTGMLAVYRPVQAEPEGGEILPWVSGEALDIGDRRMYNGVVYEVYAPAGANIWPPDGVPAIWRKVE